jgi:hypothetical protein
MKIIIKSLKNLQKDNLVVLAVFVCSSIIIAYFFFRKTEFIDVQLLVTNDNILYTDRMPPFWYEESLIEGAVEKDNFGRTIARINNIHSYEAEKNFRDIYLDISLKVLSDKRGQDQTYRGMPIKVGSFITLNPGTTVVEGIITSMEGQSKIREEIIIKTRLSNWTFADFKVAHQSNTKNYSGIDPIYAEKINIGDVIKDLDGNVMAKVIDKSVVPGKRIESDSQGDTKIIQDPLFQDVYLTLKLNVLKTSASYYYMYRYKVKVGEILPLYFETITLPVEIIEVQTGIK